jgi:RHS repeat-associated protein
MIRETQHSGTWSANQPAANSGDTGKGPVQAPAISLPKGGGAIRGIGEKFAANPVTGTGSMTVPIATSPGRSGFGPQLSLSYDSGSGNGAFGFGWSLSLPAITRKTDKGLPQYRDAEESDVFILSGAEDLVPVYRQDPDGSWVATRPEYQRDSDGFWVRDQEGRLVIHEDERDGYRVRRYRPRIEGLFARIERWQHKQTGETHWRSITRDNVTTLYGKDNNSRIFDPADPDPEHPIRIFSWLICESYDDKGNVIIYEYQEESSKDVTLSAANERNRTRSANRYLKRIKYGNSVSLLNADGSRPMFVAKAKLDDAGWMFEVLFDYGDGHYDEALPDGDGRVFAKAVIDPPANSSWPVRPDAFSSYRAGFEVRTYRLCRRVLMFHHFEAELGAPDYLVRSTDLEYSESPVASFITAIRQSGYVRQADGRYLKKSFPPLEFQYSEAKVHDEVREIERASLENLPAGLDGSLYQWVDLDGEGISGILTEQAGAWFYKRNLSPRNIVRENGRERIEPEFAPVELIASQPALALAGGAQFMDLAGDGQVDLVQLEGPVRGFYERTHDADWEPFRPFVSWPNVDTRDPNLRFVDLDGDGHSDMMITEHDVLTWYPSIEEEGFGPAQRVPMPFDEEKGPRLVFADGTQSIYLADMSGDGLTDLVRIRNGEAAYWPSLGYGRFGPKVTMDNAPWFDSPDQFDQKRIRIADIDGSGNTDIIYLHRDGVRLYFNQSGNAWSEAQTLAQFPPMDNVSNVTAVDLLGNGTACLVWSSPLPANGHAPMRYIDLMGGQKPHLLVSSSNNLGAETKVHYAPSTRFYVADKEAGTPWITRLPFPVHVVERVETYDRISRNRFVARYEYHHGYFDGDEREFRGFGRVDQWDTEEIGGIEEADPDSRASNLDEASFVPPVLTKTWFHTGVYVGRSHVSNFFAGLLNGSDKGEYYREPGWGDAEAGEHLLDDTPLPDGLSLEEEREACRALKGMMLRQEIYGRDRSEKEVHPYAVTEQNFALRRLQARAGNRHGVFFAHAHETITYNYERNPLDPRVAHTVTLEVDDFGNVERELVISYPRRNVPGRLPEQNETHITFTLNRFTNEAGRPDWYRVGMPVEARTYELVNPPNASPRLTFESLRDLTKSLVPLDQQEPVAAKTVPYEEWNWRRQPFTQTKLRLIEHVRTLYRRDDLSGPKALGEIDARGLPYESYKLALTPALAKKIFIDSNSNPHKPSQAQLETILSSEGGYVHAGDDLWWIPSGRVFYARKAGTAPAKELGEAAAHFFLPRRFEDPFRNSTYVDYDHDLLVASTEDAVGNTVVATNDFRVLQPKELIDPNRNHSEVVFDALGMVVGTAIKGKVSDANPSESGDSLEGFVADLLQAAIDRFYGADDPHAEAPDLLRDATTRIVYDLDSFRRSREAFPDDPTRWRPVYAVTLARENHVKPPGNPLKIQISFSYSDGFGREIQKKIQAEPGPVPERDANGGIITGADGQPRMTQKEGTRRWVGSDWAIFNNKRNGKPVRQYEPFFTHTHRFEFEPKIGVSPVLFYDPLERVVVTLHPNHTYEKVVFDAWQQATYDVNDTVAANNTETGDPRTDADIKRYVAKYFKTQPGGWKTWHQERITGAKGAEERRAAEKAAKHADTPTVAHLDTLGRSFLTITDNGPDAARPSDHLLFATRLLLDIEGNQRAVIDANDRVVMRYDYDMLGNRIHQISMEAGARWMLNDVAGKPIRSWNSRKHVFITEYDALRRPVRSLVKGGDANEPNAEVFADPIVFERTVYGDSPDAGLNPEQRQEANLQGKVYRQYDGAGVVTNEAYDFKGNLLRSTREIAQKYKETINWAVAQQPGEGFTTSTTYDALNRPITLTTPDKSVVRRTYNEANLLEKVHVNLRGAAAATPFVANINYNAKGQRELIAYGNGAETTYEYDRYTFRLAGLTTTRPAGPNGLAKKLFKTPRTVQDLRYTYDPAGNITQIADEALLPIDHNNEHFEAVCYYTYDAIYRLIEATGREHIGQTTLRREAPDGNYRDYPFTGLAHPNDPQALRNYTERYEYDAAGNFERVIHHATNTNWRREYDYDENSLTEPGSTKSNRLSRTTLHPNGNSIEERYTHDGHGNMTKMAHLPEMRWDFQDQLRATTRQVVNDPPPPDKVPETTYYVYDAGGQRVCKVTERQNGTRKNERLYLGAFECYREYESDGTTVNLERETLHITDDKQRVALVETKTSPKPIPPAKPEQLIRYQLGNHLGSASVELATDAELISYEEYHPYGTTAFQAGRTAAEVNLKRYRYTGKERDEDGGLYYCGARYYAPWLGKWVNCDPSVPATAEESERFLRSVRFEQELSVTETRGGIVRTKPGDARSVDLRAGPHVVSTSHTHPTSKKALFSTGDVGAYRSGGYPEDAVHSVLGFKFPTANKILDKYGAEPSLDVVRTFASQSLFALENLFLYRFRR